MNILMIGAGTMGRGIAEVFAAKGIKITLLMLFLEQLVKAKEMIQSDMDYFMKEGLVSEEEVKNTQDLIFFEADLKNAPLRQISSSRAFLKILI